ncbi:glycosyltransferase family 2 protein [Shewanella algae]|uniref:glycosyltransferase family 2 protein n=1 Tax=Shewanella algae TaxID=38313 RepID=UPI001C584AA0|nr:glycosyltransferase family 2 protein [Shewanella algae]
MSNTLPLVSVVIPVYNRSHIINRTLKSVQLQTYKNVEVVIVDDCSNDSEELKKVIDRFKGLDIKYIRHQVNRHGGAARNTGINIAKGKYIAFLDSDDVWIPSKLRESIDSILESNVDFVYSKLKTKGAYEKVYPTRGLRQHERLSDYLLVNGGTIQTSTIVIKSKVAKKVLFDDTLVRFQDYDFVVSLEKYGAISKFIDEVLVYMHDDDQLGRISNSYDPKPAIYWIEKVKGDISKEAYSAFYLNRVVRYLKFSGFPYKAISILLNKRIFSRYNYFKRLEWFLICIAPLFLLRFASNCKKLR